MSQAITTVRASLLRMTRTLTEAFSITSNLRKLTAPRREPLQGAHQKAILTPRRRSTQQAIDLAALDLIRILSTLWIITIHSYSFALSWMRFQDTQAKRDVYKSVPSQFLANGTFSVDNFFLMSGFLTFMRHWRADESRLRTVDERKFAQSKSKQLVARLASFAKALSKRYFRLVPLMMLMILFCVTVLPVLRGLSPASGTQDDESDEKWLVATQMFDAWCQTNWPVNSILAQNYLRTEQMCFSHSWYVAVDFQLFFLFELVVFLFDESLIRRLKPLLVLCALAVLTGQATSTILIFLLDLPAIPLVPAKSRQSIEDFYKYIYIKPFHWASSYFIGVLLAKLMLDSSRLRSLSGGTLRALRLGSVALLLGLVFSNLLHFQQESPMSKQYASLYSFLARPIWSLALAALIALCCLSWRASAESSANSTTSRRLLAAMSRLSYAVYLLHPVQMATFYGSRPELFQFSHYLLIYFVIGNIVIAYSTAILVYIFIESPLQNLIQLNETSTETSETERKTGRSSYALRSLSASGGGGNEASNAL